MKSIATAKWLLERAPVITGAVFCAVLSFSALSCERKGGTPDWDTPGNETTAATNESATATTPSTNADRAVASKEQAKPATVATQPSPKKDPETASSTQALRFMAYNVENWLTMDRFVDNKPLKNSPKPDSEKKAVIEMISKAAPDILGLCEIGEATDLAEIQASLKAAGLDLPHSHYTGGSDPVRHLGLLSRFPITSTAKPAEVEFQMRGQSYAINRGILDATIAARGKNYRFLGVHLKSKRTVDDFDQEEMRIHEARLLRRHVDSILASDPQSRLVVYGDFNDTRPTKAFKAVTGSYNDPGYLTAIPFKDRQGDAWTHHWAPHDIYSRIDFVLVSRALRPEVDFRGSHIVDDPDWSKASDHRPLLALIKESAEAGR
jgi:endonuclease/exonuclease/phosphatase family metal-dependent hydrolase